MLSGERDDLIFKVHFEGQGRDLVRFLEDPESLVRFVGTLVF